MNKSHAQLDPAFVETQRQRLIQLRGSLRDSTRATQLEEEGVREERVASPEEREDDAQDLAALEREGQLAAHLQQRLAGIERALQKIQDGSYGLSDVSGQPIPRQRLELVPEAVTTQSEAEARATPR
jgi:DnaK suppressor protein